MNKISPILVLNFLLLVSGCLTTDSEVHQNSGNSTDFIEDKNFLYSVLSDVKERFNNEIDPITHINYCNICVDAIDTFLNIHESEMKLSEILKLKQIKNELNNMAYTIGSELQTFVNEEENNLEYNRKLYVKRKAINDLKIINICVKKEKSKPS